MAIGALGAALLGDALMAGGVIFSDGFETRIETTMKPTELPSLAALGLYTPASAWNQPIGNSPVIDANSSQFLTSLMASGSMTIQVGQYSAPVYFADSATPRHDVVLPCGTDPDFELGITRLLGVPIPDWAVPANDVDGAGNPVPATGCGVDSDQDNHMVILDVARRCEYDLWQARKVSDTWYASLGTNISMDSDGVYPGGISSRGSGFPFLGGVIWPDELEAGRIEHALAFSYPCTATGGPVPPATFSDGVTSDVTALPMGARVQLDPNLDLGALGLEPYEHTIAVALQEYGMILVDTGGDCGFADPIGLYAIDPDSAVNNPYDSTLPSADFVPVGLPLSSLRVLQMGAQNPDFTADAVVGNGPCSDFEFAP